jgi:hypothetical protein
VDADELTLPFIAALCRRGDGMDRKKQTNGIRAGANGASWTDDEPTTMKEEPASPVGVGQPRAYGMAAEPPAAAPTDGAAKAKEQLFSGYADGGQERQDGRPAATSFLSVVNTALATGGTLTKGLLNILRVGTGAAQGVEDIERGMSSEGDGWDVAIGASRMLADAGEVASTAMGMAGIAARASNAARVAAVSRDLAEARAAGKGGPAEPHPAAALLRALRRALARGASERP